MAAPGPCHSPCLSSQSVASVAWLDSTPGDFRRAMRQRSLASLAASHSLPALRQPRKDRPPRTVTSRGDHEPSAGSGGSWKSQQLTEAATRAAEAVDLAKAEASTDKMRRRHSGLVAERQRREAQANCHTSDRQLDVERVPTYSMSDSLIVIS